jgi:predicted nucleic acid-binding Zn ribbon protein
MRRRRRRRRMLVWIGWLLTVLGVLWLAMVVAGFL